MRYALDGCRHATPFSMLRRHVYVHVKMLPPRLMPAVDATPILLRRHADFIAASARMR